MAWGCQATSHYLSQCWPRSISPYGVTRSQWVNCLLAELIFENKKIFKAYFICWHWNVAAIWSHTAHMEDNSQSILQSQYHGCWWPGDGRSQGINSYGIDLVSTEYSISPTWRVYKCLLTGWQLYVYNLCNREIYPGGHYWDYYSGTQSLSQVIATHLKIGNL